jgi:hypothetical protein
MDAIAGADLEVKPVPNLKKRKSNAHLTMSDDEDLESSPVKRPFSSMPVSRKGSPRKSLKSLYPAGPMSMENIPPMPTHAHRFSPAPGAGPEATRIQLSPLSNNELNGVLRPPGSTQSPAPTGFTAVNTGSFTAVNTTPPVKEAPREPLRQATREPSKEAHRPSPVHGHRHSNSYTSPYEPASQALTMGRPATDPPRSAPAPNITPGPGQGSSEPYMTDSNGTRYTRTEFEERVVNSSTVANGANGITKKQSPAVQHVQHAHIAPQPQPQLQTTPQTLGQPQHPAQQHVQPQAQAHTQLPTHPHIQAQQQPPPRPPSRANTPSHHFGRSIAPHPRSRSNTPHAQAAPNQPTTASNTQTTSAPAIQSAAAYGIQLIPTQEPPHTTPSSYRAPPTQIQPNVLPQAAPHQPVLKSHAEPPHIAQHPHAVQRPTIPTTDLRLLQCEVTAGLFTFFYPRPTSPPDEPALLQRLHALWYHGEPLFRLEIPSTHFDLVSKILTAWLHERQAIAALRHSMQANPGVGHVGLVDRLLAMNDLRAMRLKWKNMSSVDGMSPEDLLCMAFRVVTGTEGSEFLFKDGLGRLEVGVFEFLRGEDSKIVMQRGDSRAG